MQKPKESVFADKFRLLNSQEHAEEINWSSSESSDFENVSNSDRFCSKTYKLRNSKRKRKKKVLKNISNLDFTIVDVPQGHEKVSSEIKSPTFYEKSILRSRETSPVLRLTGQYFPSYKCSKIAATSPILTSKGFCQRTKPDLSIKSPILTLKYASPKASPRVKRYLFKSENSCEVLKEIVAKESRQSDIKEDLKHLDRRKEDNINLDNSKHKLVDKICRNVISEEIKINYNNSSEKSHNLSVSKPENEATKLQEKPEDSTLDDSYDKLKTTSFNIAKKIKSYFDSHFSSENNSQQSISINESLTPKDSSKTSDEIEIMSSITQVNTPRLSSQLDRELASKNVSPASSESAEINVDKYKKVRYKKNGLAYRLNALVKKHNANISLWQHERFLAENSNFLIPKGENVVFRIRKVSFNYGCYILKAVNMEEEVFLILINNIYVRDIKISTDAVLKLYEPYKIIDFDRDSKLIINVCKFECLTF